MSEITVGSVWVNNSGYKASVTRVTSTCIEYQMIGGAGLQVLTIPDFLKEFSLDDKDSVGVKCPACCQIVSADCIDKEDHRCRLCIEAEAKQGCKDDTPKAVQILNEAVAIMAERGKSYDKSGGEAERSMPKIVAMFNALTGHKLTPEQGWKFMCCLKLARSEQGEYREDNYLDGAAYMALAGEEAEASSE